MTIDVTAIATAGAGPSSAIASTSDVNEPERRSERVSTGIASLTIVTSARGDDELDRMPVRGARRQHRADQRRDEQRTLHGDEGPTAHYAPLIGPFGEILS